MLCMKELGVRYWHALRECRVRAEHISPPFFVRGSLLPHSTNIPHFWPEILPRKRRKTRAGASAETMINNDTEKKRHARVSCWVGLLVCSGQA